jgi:hypothetical protein
MHPRELDNLSRSALIEKAESLGVDKASLLTRAELADEIVRRTVADPIERRIARGLLGVARDLVARIVERGLHLPDAAALIRSIARPSATPTKPPIATVTLAEIYAAQGHHARALAVLDEVLDKEDDHEAARALRDQIAASAPQEPEVAGDSEEAGAAAPGQADLPAPLLERYDVDEVVLMPVDPKTVFVYWEVRRSTFDQARKRAESGRLVVRIVAVTASWDGPRVETRDIEVDELVGDWFVRDLPPEAVLRAAIGWRTALDFEPLSVAMDLAAPPDRNDRPALAIERARRRVARDAAEGASGSSSWPAIGASPWSSEGLAAQPAASA